MLLSIDALAVLDHVKDLDRDISSGGAFHPSARYAVGR
jgi:hypothetical protein